MVAADQRTHRYAATCSWSGSTGQGYEHYDRAHDGRCPPVETAVRLSADQVFRGDEQLLNPEQLLVLAASSCQLLSFLAVAARARVDIRRYQDGADAVMAEDGAGGGRIIGITLRPRITVVTETSEVTEERLHRLVRLAHEQCYIASTLSCPVTVEPSFEVLTAYAFQDTEAAARRLGALEAGLPDRMDNAPGGPADRGRRTGR